MVSFLMTGVDMANLSELRLLIRRFAEGEIPYAVFRAQFVGDYLSILHQEFDIEHDVNLIENACADFDEGDISAQDLRDELTALGNTPIISISVAPAPRVRSGSSCAAYIRHELVA